MNDVMIDLETLGRRPGCIILSIGAVMFDPEAQTLGSEFYTVVNQDSCRLNHDMHIDPETADWWRKQSNEAQKVLREAKLPDAPSLILACGGFAGWLNAARASDQVRVWGNGSDFDNPILAEAFRRTQISLPWQFWNNRCYRTLKNLYPQVAAVRSGTHHNALDDAKTQAQHALEIFKSRA